MNALSHKKRNEGAGITVIEVLVVLAILAVLTALIIPALMRPRLRASKISCVNCLKQIGLAYRIWATDHGDRFPMQVSTNEGGMMEWADSGAAWIHYQVMSNHLSKPDILVCPNDHFRTPTMNFTTLSDSNISYFVGLDADETLPQMIVSGDRNLTTNGVPLRPGLFILQTNAPIGWSAAMHQNNGNIGLADGSVQQCNAAGLRHYVSQAGRTNRLAIP